MWPVFDLRTVLCVCVYVKTVGQGKAFKLYCKDFIGSDAGTAYW